MMIKFAHRMGLMGSKLNGGNRLRTSNGKSSKVWNIGKKLWLEMDVKTVSVNKGDFSILLCSWNYPLRSQHNHHGHHQHDDDHFHYMQSHGHHGFDQDWSWLSWIQTTSSLAEAVAFKTSWKSTERIWCLSSMTTTIIILINGDFDHSIMSVPFRALGQGAFGEVYQGLFKKSQNGEARIPY